MAVVYTTFRANSGPLSVSLGVNITDIDDGALAIDHAALITSASAYELANSPIYAGFLNKQYVNPQSAAQDFAFLGGFVSAIGPMYLQNQFISIDGDGYPIINLENIDTNGVASIRIALAHSISS